MYAFIYGGKIEIIHIYIILIKNQFSEKKTRSDQMMSLKFILAFIYTYADSNH